MKADVRYPTGIVNRSGIGWRWARIDAIFSSALTKKSANSQLANVVRATATPRPPLGGEVVGTYFQWRGLIAHVGVSEFPD